MKRSISGLGMALLLVIIALSCDSHGPQDIPHEKNTIVQNSLRLDLGLEVVTNKDADLYDRPNGQVVGQVPEGTSGIVTRSKSGWAQVDFENGQTGVVKEEDLSEGGGEPGVPVAGFTYSASNLQVSFTDTSTDTDGTIVSRAWNFGDGASSAGTNPVHTYQNPGLYSVTLTVTDNDGLTDSETMAVSVTDGSTGGGDYKLIWVGFSNTRQIIQGERNGFDIGDPDPRMSGNAIQSYGDPESIFYGEGLSIVRDALNNHPDADGIAIMVGHRYAGSEGSIREGARSFDTLDFLDAPYSGSPRYSELEMMQNIGQMLDAEAPGLDHFAIALHTYNPLNTCDRKLGTHTPSVLELLVRQSEDLGYFDKLTLNGQPWSLPVVSQAAGHISSDMCHLSGPGVDYLWETTGGIIDLLESL